jgi:hypothetical protein
VSFIHSFMIHSFVHGHVSFIHSSPESRVVTKVDKPMGQGGRA